MFVSFFCYNIIGDKMNNGIKYPNGKVSYTNTIKKKSINLKKSHLGIDFESAINDSNAYYLQNNIAAIYKKPTPIQIVKVDYPSRNKARIVEAYYRTPSTTDYNGIYKGFYIDFEAKSCHTTSFSFKHIYLHQIKHLETVMQMGGISFLIIEFSEKKEIFILPTKLFIEKYHESLNGGRKSIPYEYFKTNGILINYGYAPTIDYLKAVDILIRKQNN